MDLETIKKIIAIAEDSEIGELEVEQDGFRVLVRKSAGSVTYQAAPAPPPAAASAAPVPVAEATGPPEGQLDIESPMVATFYRAPTPDAPAFVNVGDQVNPDTVVCILEAMKVMNEIKAGHAGTITEVMVENAEPVEFGQALFRVKPA